jgi:hypothetical protein
MGFAALGTVLVTAFALLEGAAAAAALALVATVPIAFAALAGARISRPGPFHRTRRLACATAGTALVIAIGWTAVYVSIASLGLVPFALKDLSGGAAIAAMEVAFWLPLALFEAALYVAIRAVVDDLRDVRRDFDKATVG